MYVIKKIAYIAVLGAALILFAGMFHFTELSNRIIVFGIGVDYEDNAHKISVEVAVPSGAMSEGAKGRGKVFEGKGGTMALALLDLYKNTGKVPSIGQCNIIVFGDDYYKTQNIAEAASFFSYADEISDGILLATCVGKASDCLKNASVLEPYVSTLLQKAIESGADKVGTARVTVKDFVNKQYDPTRDAYLTHIEFSKTAKEDASKNEEQSKLPPGYFTADKVTLFKDGLYEAELDCLSTSSLMFLTKKRSYQSFEVEDEPYEGQVFSRSIGVGVASKTVAVTYTLADKPEIHIDFRVRLKRLRNNVEDELMHFIPKQHESLSEKAKRDIERQIIKNTESIFQTSKDLKCDFIGLAKAFYASNGASFDKYSALRPDWLSDVKITVTAKSC